MTWKVFVLVLGVAGSIAGFVYSNHLGNQQREIDKMEATISQRFAEHDARQKERYESLKDQLDIIIRQSTQ